MFCLFDNIYFCGVKDLNSLNLSQIQYILNCSLNLNNLMSVPNYINLNLSQPINNLLPYINNSLNFIYDCLSKKYKIILLDDSGKENSIFIGIMFLMKYYKQNFENIYNSLSNYTSIYSKEYYNSISTIEYYLIGLNSQPTTLTPNLIATPIQTKTNPFL